MKHLDAMLLKEVADGSLVQDWQGAKFALLDHGVCCGGVKKNVRWAVGGVDVEEGLVAGMDGS